MAETKCDDARGFAQRSSSRASFSRARVVDAAVAVVVFVAMTLCVLSRGALASASAVKTRTRTLKSTTATPPARYEKRARSETAVLAPAVDSWTRRVDKALFDATSISTVSEGWRELVRKLDARERLSIVALGSSVMGVHGGCTQTSRPLRHMCEVVGKRAICCGAGMYPPPSEAGEWLRPAIDWLEEAYPVDLSKVEPLYNNPNVSHEWINIARPGGGIHSFASCLDKWLPDSENVDLFIFEFSATLELMDEGSVAEVHLARLTHELETIMHQLTQRKQMIEGSEEKRNMPAFMIVHAQNWCSPRFAKVSSGDSFAATRQLCRELPDSLIFKGYNLDVPRKEAMKSAIRDAYTRYHPVLDVYERLSEHYGIPVVNLRRGMFDVMRDSTQDESAPFALLDWTRDGLHPTQPNATRIVGSYFVNGLRMAIDATRLAYADEGGRKPLTSYAPFTFVSVEARDSDEQGRYVSSAYWSARDDAVSPPKDAAPGKLPPMLSSSKTAQIVSKCYEFGKETLTHGGDVVDDIESSGFFAWPPIVDESPDWTYVEREESGRTAHKPGYVATKKGAYIVVRQSLGKPFGKVKGVTILVSTLHSWSGYGTIAVSCSNGCSCEERVVSTQWERRVSLTNADSIPITIDGVSLDAGPQSVEFDGSNTCDVRIEVTSGDGQRVKLIGISTSYETVVE